MQLIIRNTPILTDQLSKTVKFPAFKLPYYPVDIKSPTASEKTCLVVQKMQERHGSDMKVVLLMDNAFIHDDTSSIMSLPDAVIRSLSYTAEINLFEYIFSQITATMNA